MEPQSQEQVNTTVQPPIPQPLPEIIGTQKKFPWLVVIFATLFVATLIAGTFFFLRMQSLQKQLTFTPSPTPTSTSSSTPAPIDNETADWGTYSNSKYHYQFNYPKQLAIKLFAGSQDEEDSAKMFKIDPIDGGETYAIVSITPNITKPSPGFSKTDSINGYETYFISHPSGVPSNPMPIYIIEMIGNNSNIQFTFNQTAELNAQSQKILNSFHFTGSSTTDTWKQLINQELGISIKYPDNWFVERNDRNGTRIQNYDPKTAAGRGYDPISDKGKHGLDIQLINIVAKDIDELKNKLAEQEKECMYMGDPAGNTVIKNEKFRTIAEYKLYERTSGCSLIDSSFYSQAYILDGEGNVVVIRKILDTDNYDDIYNSILNSFRFTDK